MREIGSDFHFPFRALVGPSFKGMGVEAGCQAAYLASGRDALHWIIRSLELRPGSRVLLPSYLCDEVAAPFFFYGLDMDFYKVTKDLQVDIVDLSGRLTSETRVVLYIHYFGFPTEFPSDLVTSVAPKAVIIEDGTHSFLSQLGDIQARREIRFASFRKLLPLPEGAVVQWNKDGLPDFRPGKKRRSAGYLISVACRCVGAAIKSLWLLRPGLFPKRVFRQFFSWSKSLLDTYPKPAPMSAVSRRLLKHMDFEGVVQARRRNFLYLLDAMHHNEGARPLYSHLPEGICPLGFPVLTEERERLVRHLIENKVYPPIHWKLPESVSRQEFPEAWHVSDCILTLPVDQRYGEADMARIAELVRSFRSQRVLWPAGR